MICTPVIPPAPNYRLWLTCAALFLVGIIVGVMGALLFMRCLVAHVSSQIGG